MVTIRESVLDKTAGYEILNPLIKVFIARDFGPRILAFGFLEGVNIMAIVPNAKIPLAGEGVFSLRGGHRLWAAPETPERTYAADDLPPKIIETENGVDLLQDIDRTGIQKFWQVRMSPEEAQVTIQHKLTNAGETPAELAPWAVTMLRPGGVGLLPLRSGKEDQYRVWPDRQLVFWPYTNLNSPCLQIDNNAVRVEAKLKDGALKVGAPNPAGWLAYSHRGILFIKRSAYQRGGKYTDRGASHQIYCDPGTLELETLGTLVTLDPGDCVDHLETWRLYEEGAWPEEIKELFPSGDLSAG